MRYSTLGNQDPTTYPAEIDTDATEYEDPNGSGGGPGIKILAPFGEDLKIDPTQIVNIITGIFKREH